MRKNDFPAAVILGALLLPASVTGQGNQPEPVGLLVLVHFAESIELPGISRQDLMGKIREDLGAALGPKLQVRIEATNRDFRRVLDQERERLEKKHGVAAARDKLSRLVESRMQRGLPPGGELAATGKESERAMAALEAEVRSRGNWAGLARGSIGMSIRAAKTYGGKTFPGERWSALHAGLVSKLFPPRADLVRSAPGAVDFSAARLEPYRRTYDERARRSYTLQYLANAAKQQIGFVFGLSPRRGGQPDDAMRVDIDVSHGEHLERDRAPTRYRREDLERLLAGTRAWRQGGRP